jgi:hypothetical protein
VQVLMRPLLQHKGVDGSILVSGSVWESGAVAVAVAAAGHSRASQPHTCVDGLFVTGVCGGSSGRRGSVFVPTSIQPAGNLSPSTGVRACVHHPSSSAAGGRLAKGGWYVSTPLGVAASIHRLLTCEWEA